MKHDCPKWLGWLVLVVGILFLLADYGVSWMAWWKLGWFTTVLILLGLHKVAN